jgi:hypothetical protein
MRFDLAMVDYSTKRRYLRPSSLIFREIASKGEIPDSRISSQSAYSSVLARLPAYDILPTLKGECSNCEADLKL